MNTTSWAWQVRVKQHDPAAPSNPDAFLVQTTIYDSLGRRSGVVDQAGTGRTVLAMIQLRPPDHGHELQRLQSVAQITTYAYDELGNETNQIDANQNVTSFEYDVMGRRTQRILPGSVPASPGAATGVPHVGRNQPIRSRGKPGHRQNRLQRPHHHLHVRRDEPVSCQNSGRDCAQLPFRYPSRAIMPVIASTMRDASSAAPAYTYNSRGRLTSKATPEGTLTYTYDANGDPLVHIVQPHA